MSQGANAYEGKSNGGDDGGYDGHVACDAYDGYEGG
jgi:hypothetical protein